MMFRGEKFTLPFTSLESVIEAIPEGEDVAPRHRGAMESGEAQVTEAA
jgi:hypothetical protein